MLQVINREALVERFGDWPSFHDAEVMAVRCDSGQRSNGRPSIELDVHVFAVDGVLANGHCNFVKHTAVTLRFDGVDEVEFQHFGPQNVLDDLVLEDLGAASPSAARAHVALPSNNGLGGSFRCEDVIVIAVDDFTPGRHSVYGRQQC